MTVLVRFAPSPTGFLHVGNLRTALINWLFARKHGGEFMLRFDDTDTARSEQRFEDAIKTDLQWLGLEWRRSFRQQDRSDVYRAAIERLIQSGRLYACYDTPEELEVKRKMLASRGKPPIYDRAALQLTEADRSRFEAEGRRPHYRFRLDATDIVWNDLIRGEVRINPSHISDPVLLRADGVPLYTLSSTVDDGDMGVTHILRGEDHVSNTAVQIQIFEALGYAPPQFAHNALLQMKTGKISKRTGGGEIFHLRDAGFEPMAVNSLLARLGTSDPIEVFDTLDALAAQFDIGKFGRSAALFDENELVRLNETLVQRLPFAAIQERLPKAADETFWNGVRGNCKTVDDAATWWSILHETLVPNILDRDLCAIAAECIGIHDVYADWINDVKERSAKKGRDLFMPLRIALTGREDGPELSDVFRLIDRNVASERLYGQMA